MSAARRALSTLRAPLRVATAAVSSGVLFAGVHLEERLLDADDDRRDAYVRTWAAAMLRAFAVEVVRAPSGEKPARTLPKAPRLVVANHRSMLDILVMLDLFGGHLLARGDMADWPLVGALARKAGTLFVDRKDPSSGAGAIQRIRDQLRRGKNVGVFPEGTTFPDDEVRPFHGGAFIALSKAQGEVVPVGLAYEDPSAHYLEEPFSEHARRIVLASRTRVAVVVGEAIASQGRSSGALRDAAREQVQALVREARRMF